MERFVDVLPGELGDDLFAVWLYAEDESPFAFSAMSMTLSGCGRREIESFFIAEVDRDRLVLAGSDLE